MNRLMRRVSAIVIFAAASPLLAQGTYMGDAQVVRPLPPVSQPPGSAPGNYPSGNYPPPNYPPPNYQAPQGNPPGYAAPAPNTAFSQDELDALLAPVALYPDQLLAQILMAATFPLDVVEAARFVQQYPNLKGEALDNALSTRNWDPSVLSLAAFPQVLLMMNDRLDWTRRLGDAFLADQDRVMQTVQGLRQRAQTSGNLVDTPQQRVVVENRDIYIEPAQPNVVYVPTYNPTVVYGGWWAPAYVPFYWRPPAVYYPAVVGAGVIGFSVGYYVTPHHWGWARPDWHSHRVAIDLSRRNYFIERKPYYRDWVRNGYWEHRGEAWRGSRGGRPVARAPNQQSAPADGRREARPRAEGRPARPEAAPVRTEARPARPEAAQQSRVEGRPPRPEAAPQARAEGRPARPEGAPPARAEARPVHPEGTAPPRAEARPARPEGGPPRGEGHAPRPEAAARPERSEAHAPRPGAPEVNPRQQQ